MERATQERLVGATLLIVAGVIMIPWLLDGKTTEPGLAERELVLPGSSDNGNETRRISLELPGQNDRAGGAVRELDGRSVRSVDDSATAMNLPTPARNADRSSTESARSAPVSSTAANPPAGSSGAAAQTASPAEVPARFTTRMRDSTTGTSSSNQPTAATTRAPEPSSEPAVESRTEPAPAPRPVATAAPQVSAPAEPEVKPPARSPSATPSSTASVQQWAVQVGSFASKDNAERLVGLLKDKSYKAFVMRNEVDGRVLYRVRVGPVSERSQADLLASALREDRQPARVLSHP